MKGISMQLIHYYLRLQKAFFDFFSSALQFIRRLAAKWSKIILLTIIAGVSFPLQAQLLEYLPVLIYVSLNGAGEWLDTDGDGVPDHSDSDIDGDGLSNDIDVDADGDGINVDDDAFPNNPNEWSDIDGDGIPDGLDEDRDGDGILNSVDPSPDDLSSALCP